MSMIRQLRDLWGYQDRIKQLEACNVRLADRAWRLEDERDKARADLREAELVNARLSSTSSELAAANYEKMKLAAERDATAKLLEETTASLIDAKRRNGHLLDEFDRLAGMFRKKLDDLAAAEELLDEAGGDIKLLLELLGPACEERDEYQAKLIDIERIIIR